MEEVLDLIIIGGGPIGLACALEAKKNHLNYIILKKGCLLRFRSDGDRQTVAIQCLTVSV